MKTTLIALTAATALSLGSFTLAGEAQGPVALSDAQMDNVVAGGDIIYIHNDNIPFKDGVLFLVDGTWMVVQTPTNNVFITGPDANANRGPINLCGRGPWTCSTL